MPELKEGQKAPTFTLPSSDGGNFALKDHIGKKIIVLYFYPKDMTSGCTKEACSFRDLKGDFAKAGAEIIGVSKDTLDSHGKFINKNGLNFPLLSDVDAKVLEKYGVWQEKSMYGRKFMGIVRTTFVIDKNGKIAKIWPKVNVKEHADKVLEFVKSMG